MALAVPVSTRELEIRWSDRDIARFSDYVRTKRLQLLVGCIEIGILLVVLSLAPRAALFIGPAAMLLIARTMYILYQPHRSLERYKRLKAAWDTLIEKSSPNAAMQCQIALRAGEKLTYCAPVERLAEGQGIGSLVRIDGGELVVTSERVIFLGYRNTIEIPLLSILRFTKNVIPGFGTGVYRTGLIIEYPGRLTDECYALDFDFFALCMLRRGHFPQFTMPLPPAPLPLALRVT